MGGKGKILAAGIAAMAVLLAGCSKNNNGPVGASGSGVPVSLSMSFSKASGTMSLQKTFGLTAADSIRIDSSAVVIESIRFLTNADSVSIDSTGDDGGGDHHGHGGHDDGITDDGVTFQGPFVVHVRDTVAIDLGSKLLPAGNYNGITFNIRRLQEGERHEDIEDRHHRGMMSNDSSVAGSSIVVWGAVLKNGTWTPFTLNEDLEVEFKIKGNFNVQEATGNVKIALNVNLGNFFRDPVTGAFLDPSDQSMKNLDQIKRAIRLALGAGRGGHDRNDDGHPDD